MQNKSLVAGFLVLALGATSCKEDGHDHDDNTVLIEFLEPGNEQVIPMADASNVHIHVRFTATEENHEVAVKLYPEGDPGNLLLNFDLHDHDVVINVEEDLDLSSFALEPNSIWKLKPAKITIVLKWCPVIFTSL